MIDRPRLSVLMPVYNGRAYLRAALDSVAAALVPGIEILAIDDGSTDSSPLILANHRSRLPLRVLTTARTGNWVANTNRLASEASGRWLTILHQDDVWHPDRLRRLLPVLDTDATMVAHPVDFIDPTGRKLGRWTCPLSTRVAGSGPSETLEHLLIQNFIGMPAPVFRREAFERVDGMDESMWFVADWDLWLKLASVGTTRYLPESLAGFRIHPESQTIARGDRSDELRSQFGAIFARHLPVWSARSPQVRRQVEWAARASVAVNLALMAKVQGQLPRWGEVARGLAGCSSGGWRRLLRDARLGERIASRLRLGMRRRA